MAKIAIIAPSTTAVVTQIRNAIIAGGTHTATVISSSTLSATSVDGYDAVCVPSTLQMTAISPWLTRYWFSGKPMMLFPVDGGLTEIPMSFGLASAKSSRPAGGTVPDLVGVVAHPITTGITPGTTTATATGAVSYEYTVLTSHVGTSLGTRNGGPAGAYTAAFEAGIARTNGQPNPARVAYFGWLGAPVSGTLTLSASGSLMIKQAASWLTATPPYVPAYPKGKIGLGVGVSWAARMRVPTRSRVKAAPTVGVAWSANVSVQHNSRTKVAPAVGVAWSANVTVPHESEVTAPLAVGVAWSADVTLPARPEVSADLAVGVVWSADVTLPSRPEVSADLAVGVTWSADVKVPANVLRTVTLTREAAVTLRPLPAGTYLSGARALTRRHEAAVTLLDRVIPPPPGLRLATIRRDSRFYEVQP